MPEIANIDIPSGTIAEIGSSVMNGFREDQGFANLRHSAFTALQDCPMPSTKDEYWRYTRVSPLLKKAYSIANQVTTLQSDNIDKSLGINLVFINGVFAPEHSDVMDQKDIVISDLLSAKAKHPELIAKALKDNSRNDYFSLLCDSLHQNGPFIKIGKNASPKKPIHLHFLQNSATHFACHRGLIILENSASVKIVESWKGLNSSDGLAVSTADYLIAENANIEVTKIQSLQDGCAINQDFVQQEKSSNVTFHTISMEGQLIRNNLSFDLLGEGAECHMNGLYMMKGQQHVDNHTFIRHAVPNCQSNELYKGILNESSRGVFNGKVMVMPHAQKTNAFQSNANILLTDEAQVYSKPELEIYADDVKCSHGSTTGQLDDEAMFYLQTRGLSKEGARNLLLYAFAKEVLEKLSLPELKESIDHYIAKRYHTEKDD